MGVPGNFYKSFFITIGLLNEQNNLDYIIFLNHIYINYNLLILFYKKLYIFEFLFLVEFLKTFKY